MLCLSFTKTVPEPSRHSREGAAERHGSRRYCRLPSEWRSGSELRLVYSISQLPQSPVLLSQEHRGSLFGNPGPTDKAMIKGKSGVWPWSGAQALGSHDCSLQVHTVPPAFTLGPQSH